MAMDFDIPTPGEVIYTLKLNQHHQSSPHTVHGGSLAAMMDATLGLSALSHAVTQGKLCATVEFKMNYLEPATPDEELEGKAHIDFTGKRLVVTSAEIKSKNNGKLLAKGMGTFNLYPMDKHGWFSGQNADQESSHERK